MKQILRVLWDGSTQEVVAIASALAAFLWGFVSGAHGALRVGLTVAFAALSALAVIGDAIVKHSENKAAATVTAARVAASGAQAAADAGAAANSLLAGLSGLSKPQPVSSANPQQMPPGVVG